MHMWRATYDDSQPPGGNLQIREDLDLARQANSNTIRLDVGWADIEQVSKGDRNTWHKRRLEFWLNQAQARGMKVLLTVIGTPCWASTMPNKDCSNLANWWDFTIGAPYYKPTNAQDYADFSCWLVGQYGSKLAGLEVWNEPNNPGFWRPSPSAADYMALARATWNTCRNQGVPIVVGSLSGSYGEGQYGRAFVDGMYQNGLATTGHVLAAHPYADDEFFVLDQLRQRMVQLGDAKPVWITEWGYPTGPPGGDWSVSEQEQAERFTSTYNNIYARSWIQGTLAYELRDGFTGAPSMEDNFGLVRSSRTPTVRKPAFYALAEAMGSP